ncbi:MAG: hypothetical protein QGG96_04960 [Candidatus Poseidoniaceae archaeon]|nr:hypothetical protein [Candidatus Poseidoniaceae archaeon]
MAAKKTKNPLAKLMALPGVGKVAATKMQKAGIKTPAGIKKAGVKGLVKAGLSAALSKKLLAGSKAPSKKKAAAKKVAPKKKAAAKKAPAKKKAAAKKKAPAKSSTPKSSRRGSNLKAPSLAELLKQIKSKK